MKYDYSVKVNGRWYPPDAEIPKDVKKSAEEAAGTLEETKENDQRTSGKPKAGNSNKQ